MQENYYHEQDLDINQVERQERQHHPPEAIKIYNRYQDLQHVEHQQQTRKQEKMLATCETDWPVFASSYRAADPKRHQLALCSYLIGAAENRLQIREYVEGDEEPTEPEPLVTTADVQHPYPATHAAWLPSAREKSHLLCSTGQALRLWAYDDETNLQEIAVLSHHRPATGEPSEANVPVLEVLKSLCLPMMLDCRYYG
ncbi:unnamed protein product [Amoebophrya sp. A25]|nr:unnamed protein product [Amoebophrya sp. A25]|eukprot:GSA25T00016860001.1